MIKLLDGSEWSKKEILEKVSDEKFYYDYLGKAAFSSTAIGKLLESPKTYAKYLKDENVETQALRDGYLIHCCVLEPEVYDTLFFTSVSGKNTKTYKDAVKKHGKVFTSTEKKHAELTAEALLRNEMFLSHMSESQTEVPEVGMININGKNYAFRAKADILRSKDGENVMIADLKTTSSIKGWQYSAQKYNYDVQCWIYCNLFNVDPEWMVFLVIDKYTFDIGRAWANVDFYKSGEQKVISAIEKYEEWHNNPNADLDQYYINIQL